MDDMAIRLRGCVALVETARDGCEAGQTLVMLLNLSRQALAQLPLRQALAARGHPVTMSHGHGVLAFEESLLQLRNEQSGVVTLQRVAHGWPPQEEETRHG